MKPLAISGLPYSYEILPVLTCTLLCNVLESVHLEGHHFATPFAVARVHDGCKGHPVLQAAHHEPRHLQESRGEGKGMSGGALHLQKLSCGVVVGWFVLTEIWHILLFLSSLVCESFYFSCVCLCI